jgi:hypothetical protein
MKRGLRREGLDIASSYGFLLSPSISGCDQSLA